MNQEFFYSPDNPELAKILDMAESMLLKYGIRSVSMSDLAQNLGMSKKTLYQYVENKEDLLDKALRRHLFQEFQCIQKLIAAAQNALDELRQISLHVQQKLQSISSVLIFDIKKYHPELWGAIMRFQAEVVQHQITSNLQRGMEQGLYRDDLNVEFIGRVYGHSMLAFIDGAFFENHSRTQIHQQFIKYHIMGIVSQKGRDLIRAYGMWEER